MLNEVIKIVNSNGADSYQIIEQVLSVNKVGTPRLNNFVWPGYNSVIIIQVQDLNIYKQIIEALKNHNLNSELPDEKVMVTCWNIDNFFFE
jgi:hypothetical protein